MSRSRWQWFPAVPEPEKRAAMVDTVKRVRLQVMYGSQGRELDEFARANGVSLRTLQRYAHHFFPCPGYPKGSCMTNVQGGGLCGFCRKSKALA